jgi:hypothetical protein
MIRGIRKYSRNVSYSGRQDVFVESDGRFEGINRLTRPLTILFQTRFYGSSYCDRGLTKDKQIICKEKMMNGLTILSNLQTLKRTRSLIFEHEP